MAAGYYSFEAIWAGGAGNGLSVTPPSVSTQDISYRLVYDNIEIIKQLNISDCKIINKIENNIIFIKNIIVDGQ